MRALVQCILRAIAIQDMDTTASKDILAAARVVCMVQAVGAEEEPIIVFSLSRNYHILRSDDS